MLDLGTRWRLVIRFTSRPLCLRDIIPGTRWMWGSVGSRLGLDVRRRENLLLLPGIEKRNTPYPSRYTEWAVMALSCVVCSREVLSPSVEGLSTSTTDRRILTYLRNSCGWTGRIRNTFEVPHNIVRLLAPIFCVHSNTLWCPDTVYFQPSY